MFGRKKEPSKGKGKALVDKMGLFGDLSDLEKDVYGDIENDPELEAELLALQQEECDSRGSPKKNQPTSKASAAKPKFTNQVLEMDRLISEGLKDIPSDEDVSDTEDPDLLAELEGLSTDEPEFVPAPEVNSPTMVAGASGGNILSLVQDRLEMYEIAHSNAKSTGDSSKARRLERGLKTLRDLVRKGQLGREIKEDDIPPAVAAGKVNTDPQIAVSHSTPEPQQSTSLPSKPAPTPIKPSVSPKPTTSHAPTPPAKRYIPPVGLSADEIETHKALCMRQDQFKQAALQAKHSGDVTQASVYLKYYKTFEAVIKAFVVKQPIDLSEMPPPPPGFTAPTIRVPRVEHERAQHSAAPPVEDEPPEPDDEEYKKLCNAPESAGTVMEALQQRRDKYQSSANTAKEEGASGKQRRMGRIVKQYEDAIKAHRSGKPGGEGSSE